MKGYKHLSNEERYFIYVSLKAGMNQKEVAGALGRHPSTISREVRAGMTVRSIIYTYEWATFVKRHRMKSKQRKRTRKITPEIGKLIEDGLEKYWSPEQVSGDLKRNHDTCVSHETIYRYIFSDAASSSNRLSMSVRRFSNS